MTCIKTGADVYIASHGAIAHGDLYQVDGVYILNSAGCPFQYRIDKELDPVNLCIWSDKCEVIGGNITVATVDQCSTFDYFGASISVLEVRE